MAWGRLDDEFDENENVLALTHAEFRLWVCSWSATLRWKTNGVLSEARAKSLARKHGVSLSAISGLVDKGRWEAVDDGYHVHDIEHYTQRNTPELSAVRAEAGRRGGVAKAVANGSKLPADDLAKPQQNGTLPPTYTRRESPNSQNPVPVPVAIAPGETPTPSPQKPRQTRALTDRDREVLDEFAAAWNDAAGTLPKLLKTPTDGNTQRLMLATWEYFDGDVEALMSAVRTAAADEFYRTNRYGIETFCRRATRWAGGEPEDKPWTPIADALRAGGTVL